MSKLVIYGLTSAVGGIERLMRSFILRVVEGRLADVAVVAPYSHIAFENELAEHGVEIVYLPSIRSHQYKRALDQFIQSLKQSDVFYANVSSYCNYKLFHALSKANCKVIIHGHNATTDGLLKKTLHAFNRKKYAKLGIKIAVSEISNHFMFNGNANKVIYNGIDVEENSFDLEARKSLRGQMGISKNTPVIGCVGRISTEKNQAALAEISKKWPQFSFVFVGDFMSEKYKNLVRAISGENCIFVGGQSNVGKWYSAFDALSIPSKMEAFPLAACEALANGLPVYLSKDFKDVGPAQLCSSNLVVGNDFYDFNEQAIVKTLEQRNNGVSEKPIIIDRNECLSSLLGVCFGENVY